MTALTDAFLRTSRFHAVGLVVDLHHGDTAGILALIQNSDGIGAVRLARRTRMRYVVLAGQLLRRKGGVFAALVAGPETLPGAATVAAGRLAECGETASLWAVVAETETREAVLAALGVASGTEGSA